MRLLDAINTYKVIARAEAKSERTIEWVVESTGYFIRFLGKDPPLDQVTPQDARRWIAALQQKTHRNGSGRLSPTTIRQYFRGFQLLFRVLEREGYLGHHPIADMKAPKAPQKVVKPFSDREVKRLLKACTGPMALRNRAILMLLLDTGIRASELTGLELQDVDLEERTLKVLGKGARERVTTFGRRTAKALLAYLVKARGTEDGALFLSDEGTRLTRYGLATVLKRIGRRAGVKHVHAHRFRHTFALNFIKATGDSFRLQRALGHSSVAMTRRYLDLAQLDLTAKRFSVADSLRL